MISSILGVNSPVHTFMYLQNVQVTLAFPKNDFQNFVKDIFSWCYVIFLFLQFANHICKYELDQLNHFFGKTTFYLLVLSNQVLE